MTEPVKRYFALEEELFNVRAQHKEDISESHTKSEEDILDEMDKVWYELSEDQMDEVWYELKKKEQLSWLKVLIDKFSQWYQHLVCHLTVRRKIWTGVGVGAEAFAIAILLLVYVGNSDHVEPIKPHSGEGVVEVSDKVESEVSDNDRFLQWYQHLVRHLTAHRKIWTGVGVGVGAFAIAILLLAYIGNRGHVEPIKSHSGEGGVGVSDKIKSGGSDDANTFEEL